MSRFSTDFQVGRSTGCCAATGRELLPGTMCMAALCDREGDEGFDRLDFSIEAWESGERPPRLFSYWKATVPDPEEKQKVFVDDAVLMDVFERLAADERPKRIAFRFVLALILMRKKQLKPAGRIRKGDDEWWLVRAKGADPDQPSLEVLDPNLAENDVQEIMNQLGEILQGEL